MDPKRLSGHRVAIVTPYSKPVVGGVTTFVEGLVQGLKSAGLQVQIWTRFGAADTIAEQGPKDPVEFARWARRRIREWRPDVVHAHSHWYALSAAYVRGRPIAPRTVFSVHTEFNPRRSAPREYLLARLLAKADVVTAVSPQVMEGLRVRFPRLKRVELLRPGVRPLPVDDREVQNVVESCGWVGSGPRLCAVGMMVWPEKVRGMDLLIQSMPVVLERNPGAKLVFVGDGPERARLVESVRANRVEDAVVFAGSRDSPAAFIAASDIVLHASFLDSYPQVIPESLSLGRPVIANREVASRISADPGAMGILACDATPQSFAAAVTQLMSDSRLRTEMGRRGRDAMNRDYTWDHAVARVISLYGLGE